jgi:DHA2 family multidrug resistance protein-like MFS transporter
MSTVGRKEWLGLGVLVLPSMLLFMMLTILFLAIPHLAADLAPSSTQLLWILDIYGFLMAGFLVTMGTLGDRIGRRRLLIVGAAVFGVVSVVAAFTDDPAMMIVWRAVLGVAAAAQMPATLGLIFTMFHDARQRGVAIGTWAGSISAGVALGPLLGGVLLEAFSWRATFLVAVPVMAVVLIGAPLLLPNHRNPDAGRLDLVSVLLLLATVLPFIYGIKGFAKEEPVTVSLLGIAAGLAFGAWFVIRQLRSRAPLLDVRLFANRTVSGALVVFVLAATGLGGVYFLFTQYLQLVAGLSPLRTGLSILPGALALVVVSTLAPILARRVRPGNVIAAGLAVQVVGYLMLTQVGSASGLPLLIAGFVVLYPAVAPSMALTTDLVVSSVPPERAGAASGLSTTASDLGISLGIAVIGSVGVATYRSRVDGTLPAGLPPQAHAAARDSLDGAVATAERLPAELAAAVLESARAAFTSGLNLGAMVAAVIAATAAVIAATRLRHVPPTGSPTPSPSQRRSRRRRTWRRRGWLLRRPEPGGPGGQVVLLPHAGRAARRGLVVLHRRRHITGHLEQVRAHSIQPVVPGQPLVQRIDRCGPC